MRRRGFLKGAAYLGAVGSASAAITWKTIEESLEDEADHECLEKGNESYYDGEHDNADRGLEAYENESNPLGGMSEQICERSENEYNDSD